MKLRHVLLTAGIALAVGSPALSAPANKPVFGDWGYDASAMDNSIKPGDDFFAYVNGSWDKRTQIDPQRTFAGIDSVLNDQIDRDVRDIIEDMARDPSANGQIGGQIGDFYASWMDEPAIEAKAAQPLTPYLDRIGTAKTRTDLVDLFGTIGFTAPVSIGIN